MQVKKFFIHQMKHLHFTEFPSVVLLLKHRGFAEFRENQPKLYGNIYILHHDFPNFCLVAREERKCWILQNCCELFLEISILTSKYLNKQLISLKWKSIVSAHSLFAIILKVHEFPLRKVEPCHFLIFDMLVS